RQVYMEDVSNTKPTAAAAVSAPQAHAAQHSAASHARSAAPDEDGIRPVAYYRVKNHTHRVLNLLVDEGHGGEATRLRPKDVVVLEGRRILDNPRLLAQISVLRSTQQITLRDMKVEVNRTYLVRNETPRRIGIKHFDTVEDLVLPPFGSRAVSSDLLIGYDYLPWTWQSLVTVSPMVRTTRNRTALIWRFLMMLFFILFLMVSLPLAIIKRDPLIWNVTAIISLLFLLAFTILHYLIESRNELDSFFNQVEDFLHIFPGIALVLAIGIGLPVIAYNQQITAPAYLPNLGTLASLGRFMEMMFVSIASILPALLYYLFGRMQVAKQRDSFFREVLVLDPHVESFSEAESKYAPLLESVYGTGSSPFSILLLVISTALLVMGWMIALPPNNVVLTADSTLLAFFQLNADYFVFGFLGAYFFAINMIFRRYVRADLTPKTYAYITVRLLITIVLVWVIQTLPQFEGVTNNKLINSSLYATSFLVGIFPDWGVAMIKDAFRNVTRKFQQDDNDDAMPLSDLEGMNLYDRARLLEEGIENIENLVHHNLMELIARTRIPTSRLVDMFDQSILYLHLGIYDDNDDKKNDKDLDYNGRDMLSRLKSVGIRTASGLITLLEENARGDSLLSTELSPEEINRLKLIAEAIKGEVWLACIQNWIRFNHIVPPVSDPYKFYYHDEDLMVTVQPEPASMTPPKGLHPPKKKRIPLAPVAPPATAAPPPAMDLKEPKLAEGQG
ncbi:MAG TPA: hypothetical protein VF806_04710, partial [Anaerolineaceae bacterium]